MQTYTIQQLLNILEGNLKWVTDINPLKPEDWPRIRKIAELDMTFCGLPLMMCYLFDGEWVRDQSEEYQDCIMGSNWGRWKFTPRNEFWIDATVSRREDKTTIMHEAEEYYGIVVLGLSYFGDDGAHAQWGNKVERILRLRKQQALQSPMKLYA